MALRLGPRRLIGQTFIEGLVGQEFVEELKIECLEDRILGCGLVDLLVGFIR